MGDKLKLIKEYILAKRQEIENIHVDDIFTAPYNPFGKIRVIIPTNKIKLKYNIRSIRTEYTYFEIPVECLTKTHIDELIAKNKETDRIKLIRQEYSDKISELEKQIALMKKQLNPKPDIKTEGVYISPRDFKDDLEDVSVSKLRFDEF